MSHIRQHPGLSVDELFKTLPTELKRDSQVSLREKIRVLALNSPIVVIPRAVKLRRSGRRGCQRCLDMGCPKSSTHIVSQSSISLTDDDALKECEEQADYWQCRVNELKSGVRTLAADAEEDQTT